MSEEESKASWSDACKDKKVRKDKRGPRGFPRCLKLIGEEELDYQDLSKSLSLIASGTKQKNTDENMRGFMGQVLDGGESDEDGMEGGLEACGAGGFLGILDSAAAMSSIGDGSSAALTSIAHETIDIASLRKPVTPLKRNIEQQPGGPAASRINLI